jgi:hypothetical protein
MASGTGAEAMGMICRTNCGNKLLLDQSLNAFIEEFPFILMEIKK